MGTDNSLSIMAVGYIVLLPRLGASLLYFIPIDCLRAFDAKETPTFVAVSKVHFPAAFKCSAIFDESFAFAADSALDTATKDS